MEHQNECACNELTFPTIPPTPAQQLEAAIEAHVRPLGELLKSLQAFLRPDPDDVQWELELEREKVSEQAEAMEAADGYCETAGAAVDEALAAAEALDVNEDAKAGLAEILGRADEALTELSRRLSV